MPKFYVACQNIRFIVDAKTDKEAAQKCFDFYNRDIDLFAPLILMNEIGWKTLNAFDYEKGFIFLNDLKGAEHVDLDAIMNERGNGDDDWDEEWDEDYDPGDDWKY